MKSATPEQGYSEILHEEVVRSPQGGSESSTRRQLAMEERKVKGEGSGKGGGRTFHRRNFKKKETMFKDPEFETIVFSYG